MADTIGQSAAPRLAARVLRRWRLMLACGLALLVCGGPFRGGCSWLVAAIVLLWLIVKVCQGKGRQVIPGICAWLVTFGIIGGLHYHYASVARANGEDALAHIVAYRAVHGYYPVSLEASGFDTRRIHSMETVVSYGLHDGEPYLCHMDTFMLFSSYCYSFSTRTWDGYSD